MIYPKNDMWSHECLYDIMMACEEVECLKGVHIQQSLPNQCNPDNVPLGLGWKPTDENRKLQEKALRKRFKRRYDMMLSKNPIYQEMLETSPYISMDFHSENFATNGMTFTDWKADFPRLQNFKEFKYMDRMISLFGHSVRNSYVRCMLMKADEYLPLSTFNTFPTVLIDLGHTVVSTSGFWMRHRGWSYLEVRNITFDYLYDSEARCIEKRDEERREKRLGELEK
jgi:hypothetical protein